MQCSGTVVQWCNGAVVQWWSTSHTQSDFNISAQRSLACRDSMDQLFAPSSQWIIADAEQSQLESQLHCTLHAVHSTLHDAYCTQHTAHCMGTLHTPGPWENVPTRDRRLVLWCLTYQCGFVLASLGSWGVVCTVYSLHSALCNDVYCTMYSV